LASDRRRTAEVAQRRPSPLTAREQTVAAARVVDVVLHVQLGKLRDVNLKDYLPRFVLGAGISIGAALLATAVGLRFGGMFLAFPSILPASLSLVQHEEGTNRAGRDAISAILGGGFGMCVFGLMVEKTVLGIEPFLSIVLALLGWVLTSLVLYAVLATLQPEACDKRQEGEE
jgi:hypothetical protein